MKFPLFSNINFKSSNILLFNISRISFRVDLVIWKFISFVLVVDDDCIDDGGGIVDDGGVIVDDGGGIVDDGGGIVDDGGVIVDDGGVIVDDGGVIGGGVIGGGVIGGVIGGGCVFISLFWEISDVDIEYILLLY